MWFQRLKPVPFSHNRCAIILELLEAIAIATQTWLSQQSPYLNTFGHGLAVAAAESLEFQSTTLGFKKKIEVVVGLQNN